MNKLVTSLMTATVAVTGAIAIANSASAATISHTASVGMQLTNFTDALASLPKFDSSLGMLNSVTIGLTGQVAGTAKAESLDASPANITLNLQAFL